MKDIILMSGPPGCGKTSYITKQMEGCDPTRVVAIHRDDLRLQLRIIHDTQDYFPVSDREEMLFFVQEINKAMADPIVSTIYIDATLVNRASRKKLLSLLDLKEMSLTCVNFLMDEEVMLERNASRKGYDRVPPSVIKRMIVQQELATAEELREVSNAAEVYVLTIEHIPQ
jgi:predicted kinase